MSHHRAIDGFSTATVNTHRDRLGFLFIPNASSFNAADNNSGSTFKDSGSTSCRQHTQATGVTPFRKNNGLEISTPGQLMRSQNSSCDS
jgi:hypothetical protein